MLRSAIFGELGIITSRLQMGYDGTIMTGMCFGSSISVIGDNTVNFPALVFSGGSNIPKVFIAQTGGGSMLITGKSKTSFTYSATTLGHNVDYLAIQSG